MGHGSGRRRGKTGAGASRAEPSQEPSEWGDWLAKVVLGDT